MKDLKFEIEDCLMGKLIEYTFCGGEFLFQSKFNLMLEFYVYCF